MYGNMCMYYVLCRKYMYIHISTIRSGTRVINVHVYETNHERVCTQSHRQPVS